MIRVLLVDDQALLRAGLRMILENADDIAVTGEADDGATATALAIETTPDVVLMDIRMPDVDGLEATRRIRASLPDRPRILILTTFDLDEYVYAALRAVPAASCSRTPSPPICCPGSAWWPGATPSSLPRSPGG
jgi:DNA-binding NarL/FixJ family response regulator